MDDRSLEGWEGGFPQPLWKLTRLGNVTAWGGELSMLHRIRRVSVAVGEGENGKKDREVIYTSRGSNVQPHWKVSLTKYHPRSRVRTFRYLKVAGSDPALTSASASGVHRPALNAQRSP